MTVTRMIPLVAGAVCAGAVAFGLMAIPAAAGGRQNDDNRIQSSQRWQDDGQVSRRNSDRFEQWQGNKQSKRDRRAERREARKARKAQRHSGAAGTFSGGEFDSDLDNPIEGWAYHPPVQQAVRPKDGHAGSEPQWWGGNQDAMGMTFDSEAFEALQ